MATPRTSLRPRRVNTRDPERVLPPPLPSRTNSTRVLAQHARSPEPAHPHPRPPRSSRSFQAPRAATHSRRAPSGNARLSTTVRGASARLSPSRPDSASCPTCRGCCPGHPLSLRTALRLRRRSTGLRCLQDASLRQFLCRTARSCGHPGDEISGPSRIYDALCVFYASQTYTQGRAFGYFAHLLLSWSGDQGVTRCAPLTNRLGAVGRWSQPARRRSRHMLRPADRFAGCLAERAVTIGLPRAETSVNVVGYMHQSGVGIH